MVFKKYLMKDEYVVDDSWFQDTSSYDISFHVTQCFGIAQILIFL